MIIFVHIPKTAGTSLAHAFDVSCSRRMFYDYDPDYRNTVMRPGEEEFFLRHKEFIQQKFDYIHGHFYLSKYKAVFAEENFVTCFREPVDRIISQFKHHYFETRESPVGKAIQSGKMTIVDFASQKHIRDAQVVHMDGYSLDDLAFFFLTDALPHGIRVFNKILGKNVAVPLKLNTAESQRARSLRQGKEGARPDTMRFPKLGMIFGGPSNAGKPVAEAPRAAPQFTAAELAEVARVAAPDMDFYRLAVDRYKSRFGDVVADAAAAI